MTIFFYGPNVFELKRQVASMVAAYIAKTGSDTELERIDGATATWAELTRSLSAVPFLASSRLVVVEGAAANREVGPRLGEVLGQVPQTTVAVFAEREVDQRTAVFKQLKNCDKVLKFEPLPTAKLALWVRAEVQQLGGTITVAVVNELMERVGNDQWRLSNEISKLVAYRSDVTSEAVRELVPAEAAKSVFDMVEAMSAGRAGVALASYKSLLAQKQGELAILAMIQWQLRNLLLLKTAPAAMSPADVASAAGMSPFVAAKAAAAAGRLDEAALVEAFCRTVECEYQIKTGRVGAEVGVEQLIWRVASQLAPEQPLA